MASCSGVLEVGPSQAAKGPDTECCGPPLCWTSLPQSLPETPSLLLPSCHPHPQEGGIVREVFILRVGTHCFLCKNSSRTLKPCEQRQGCCRTSWGVWRAGVPHPGRKVGGTHAVGSGQEEGIHASPKNCGEGGCCSLKGPPLDPAVPPRLPQPRSEVTSSGIFQGSF